jgi:galactonate dehydratase
MGIYQAASLHAAAALPNVPWHEYQHTVLDRNLAFMDTTMCCRQGFFEMPQGAGLGIEPLPTLWQYIAPKAGS